MAGLLGSVSHVLVRWIHVAGMAVLVGGAAFVWWHLHSAVDGSDGPDGDRASDDWALATAESYEWLFWGAVGLVVLTGVGNLGAMAPAIPDPSTRWGATFGVKLVVVAGLLVGSLVRTLAVVRWQFGTLPDGDGLRRAYAATTVYLLALVALAEVLAHG